MESFKVVFSQLGLGGLKPTRFPDQAGEAAPYLHGSGEDVKLTSWFGTPVFADVRFSATEDTPEFQLESVLVEVTQTKNIVTTAIQGRNGTVKEYINDGDYQVKLRGLLSTPRSYSYPVAGVRQLLQILQKKEALEVVSDYLRLFNVYNLVVVSYSLPQVEGFQNTQVFDIDCLSDQPIELISEDDV